jgi:hypothetical protein
VQAIEQGQAGTLQTLEQHAEALGVSIVDIFQTVIRTTAQALSPEAHRVARKYETTTVEGRQAFLTLANALPDAPPSPSQEAGLVPRSPRGPAPATPRRLRPAPHRTMPHTSE